MTGIIIYDSEKGRDSPRRCLAEAFMTLGGAWEHAPRKTAPLPGHSDCPMGLAGHGTFRTGSGSQKPKWMHTCLRVLGSCPSVTFL